MIPDFEDDKVPGTVTSVSQYIRYSSNDENGDNGQLLTYGILIIIEQKWICEF
jgi:hypothetical protein